MGKKQFCFFQTAETGNRTPDSGVKGSGANHYPRAPALFYGYGLSFSHGFPDIMNIKVNNGNKSAIFNFIELKLLRAYPYLKPHILFYSNGSAIWHGFPDINPY